MRIAFTRLLRHQKSFSQISVRSQSAFVRVARPSSFPRFYSDFPRQRTSPVKMSDQAPKEEVNLHKDPLDSCNFCANV